jgi:hypothetical protein
MIYATFSEFNARYTTKLTPDDVSSHLLPYASARLDAALASCFAVPLSADNLTAKDLTLDLAYLLLLQRSKAPAEAAVLAKSVAERIAALTSGQAAMMTTSGQALYAAGVGNAVWSAPGDGPVFDLGSANEQQHAFPCDVD